MSDIIIVGAGVVGSVIGRALETKGHSVRYVDSSKPYPGTYASGGLIHPKWVSHWPREEVAGAMELLKALYPVKEMALGDTPVHVLSPSVTRPKVVVMEDVIQVGDGFTRSKLGYEVEGGNLRMAAPKHFGTVIVCAGAWSGALVKMPKIQVQCGTSFLWHTDKRIDPVVKQLSPRKNLVAFNREHWNIWSHDGTSVYPENYTDKMEQECLSRVRHVLDIPETEQPRVIRGYSPLVPGHKGYLKRVHPNTWVATGGGKCSTVFAAMAANKLLEEL